MVVKCLSRCVAVISPQRRLSGPNNDCRIWVTLGNSSIDDLTIIRHVCRQRRNISIDLIRVVRQFRDVADLIRRQFHRDDFMRIGIDTEMQLARPAAGPDAVLLIEPLALAVNLQPGAIDRQMQRLCAVNSPRQDRQAATAAAQCDVIGDGDVNFEHVGDRLAQTLSLPPEARFDDDSQNRSVDQPAFRWPVPAMQRPPPR
jgi:hypothetical protein